MKMVFLMDPLESVHLQKDTSFALMCCAHQRGHEVFFCPQGGIIFDQGKVKMHGERIFPQEAHTEPFVIRKKTILFHDDIDAVFVRTDPPFDEQYLFDTWMLDLLPPSVFVLNRPAGLRTVNEKLWAAQFVDLTPPTLVSRHKADLLPFLQKQEKVIAKPTNSFGGQGVFLLDKNGANLNVIIETLTMNETRAIILQTFVPEADIGDKRILLLNGEPLGAVLRVHKEGEHRNNFFSGGCAQACDLTDRDREIMDRIKPQLQALGLYFVGIDIIGNTLIEVNVTSPTCLREMNALYNKHLEETVMVFVEQQIKKHSSKMKGA